MNRTLQPEIQELVQFNILPPERTVMPNGVPLTVINAGEQDVVRVDILFGGGRWQQSKNYRHCLRTVCCVKDPGNIRRQRLLKGWIITGHGSNCPVRRNMHMSHCTH